MSTDNIISVHSQTPDFSFDDVDALNADLMQTGIGYRDREAGKVGKFFDVKDGEVSFFDLEDGSPSNSSMIWYLMNRDVINIIGRHVASGNIVFEFSDIEGEGEVGWMRFTPGKGEMVLPSGFASSD